MIDDGGDVSPTAVPDAVVEVAVALNSQTEEEPESTVSDMFHTPAEDPPRPPVRTTSAPGGLVDVLPAATANPIEPQHPPAEAPTNVEPGRLIVTAPDDASALLPARSVVAADSSSTPPATQLENVPLRRSIRTSTAPDGSPVLHESVTTSPINAVDAAASPLVNRLELAPKIPAQSRVRTPPRARTRTLSDAIVQTDVQAPRPSFTSSFQQQQRQRDSEDQFVPRVTANIPSPFPRSTLSPELRPHLPASASNASLATLASPSGSNGGVRFASSNIHQPGWTTPGSADSRFFYAQQHPQNRLHQSWTHEGASIAGNSDDGSYVVPNPSTPVIAGAPGSPVMDPSLAPFLRVIMSKQQTMASASGSYVASSDNADSFVYQEDGTVDGGGVLGMTSNAEEGGEEEEGEVEMPDIEDIMADLSLKFGYVMFFHCPRDMFIMTDFQTRFQDGILQNVTEYLKSQIASRAARLRVTPVKAIISLHNDYISGRFANYRLWALSDAVRDPEEEFDLGGAEKDDVLGERERRRNTDREGFNLNLAIGGAGERAKRIHRQAEREWRRRYRRMNVWDKTHQLALYLCLMDEAANVRLMPELLCFLFKLADEYCEADHPEGVRLCPKGAYLNDVVRRIYDFHRLQVYEADGTRRETDHAGIVGYDDINETFWERGRMRRIVLGDGTKLLDVPEGKRWERLREVDWAKSFRKTFYERRTFASHLLVNFSRIWALLFGTYVMFLMSIMAPSIWKYRHGNPPLSATLVPLNADPIPDTVRYTLISSGGAVAVLVSILATVSEWWHVPHTTVNFRILSRRLGLHALTLIFCVLPALHLIFFDHASFEAMALTAVGFVINVSALIAHSLVPPAVMDRRKLANQVFVGSFTGMDRRRRGVSWGLWGLLLVCKFVESWLIIFVPVQKAVEAVYGLDLGTCATGFIWCAGLKWLTIAVMIILFGFFYFLDTYVWWLVWTSILQFSLSSFRVFKLLKWDKVLPSLPEKLHPRLFASRSMNANQNPRSLYARTWNAIIDDLRSTHHLGADQAEKLRFGEVVAPVFVPPPGTSSSRGSISNGHGSNAPRASTPSDVPTKVDSITPLSPYAEAQPPTWSNEASSSGGAAAFRGSLLQLWQQQQLGGGANVFGGGPTFFTDPPHLVALRNGATKVKVFEGTQNEAERRLKFLAHTLDMEFPELGSYKEKIILSWEEITARDPNSAHSLLRYLQLLHPEEWTNFVEACKEELQDDEDPQARSFTSAISNLDQPDPSNPQSFPPSLVLKTRLWCSARSQTLWRTIAGFQKYRDALGLMYALEAEDELARLSPLEREREVARVVDEKFRVVVSCQMYTEFDEGEVEDIVECLETWLGLNVVYPARIKTMTGERVFSHIVDGYCGRDASGKFIPRITVELPGWPILGDGKGCNQNHGIFFTRGEFIQTIDANQDHYFEECLKVRSILNEFNRDPRSPPVALVGLRENIFTHGVGAVADMSATTETTLVSLNQPILNKLGARMHYGHPDFWNMPYIITRGGVSKAQRGLHLNEDIFAGMMVFMRGGVNKHAEYMQVGKGKDLGVNSVMGYFSKLAMGMSEQIMSREQHRIGSALPFDRLMTFFFANPGYVLSNVMAMASLQTFVLLLVCLAALASNLIACPDWQILGDGITFNQTQVQQYPAPAHCVVMSPVYDWERIIVLTFIPVFFIILIPVLTHTAFESGANSILRYLRQLGSLSLVFSILSTQTWARSFLHTTVLGQAKHVQTGRSIEVVRKPFYFLFTNYHDLSLSAGILLIGGLLYASTAAKGETYGLIFFWASVPPLIVAPFFYNPHQFRFSDFMLDYARTLKWFGGGVRRGDENKDGSWIDWRRAVRAQMTGHRRSKVEEGSIKKGKKGEHMRRATRSTIWVRELVFPTVVACAAIIIYTVGSGTNHPKVRAIEVVAAALGPLVINFVFLLALQVVTVLVGPCLGGLSTDGVAPITVTVARCFSLLVFLVAFLCGAWVMSLWTLSVALLWLMATWLTTRAASRWILVTLPREMDTDEANLAWWDGRELLCKTVEMVAWPMDLFVAHVILFLLFPATLIKYVDDAHSMLIMWVITKFEEPALSREELARRRRRIGWASVVFLFWLMAFLAFIIVPVVVKLPNLESKMKIAV
ncbi:1,3-beta-D-glucan synthase [Irineochytrium annulatum]|nr:1,3-beta-D-glucan synthase [Irineochytrium annulatum]